MVLTKRKAGVDENSTKRAKGHEESSNTTIHRATSSFPNSQRGQQQSNKADEPTLQNRRLVKVTSPSTKKKNTTSTNQNVSKVHRSTLKQIAFYKLNRSFAHWARVVSDKFEAELHFKHSQPSSPSSKPHEPKFYWEAATEYIRRADIINQRYDRHVGDVLTIGSGDCGQLGLSEGVEEVQRPKLVMGLRNMGVTLVACGGLHNAAVLDDGRLFTWGANDKGSLGQFFAVEGYLDSVVATAWVPGRVHGFVPSKSAKDYCKAVDKLGEVMESGAEEAIAWVAVGASQTLCLSTTGNVYMFGSYIDDNGKEWRDMTPPDDVRGRSLELEVNAEIKARLEKKKDSPRDSQEWPIHVFQMPGKVKDIYCGDGFNAALLEKSFDDDEEDDAVQLVTWGIGAKGELGRKVRPILNAKNGEYDYDAIKNEHLRPLPPVWDGPKLKRKVEMVACGAFHIVVVSTDIFPDVRSLAVYSSGLNNYGQLGHGDTTDRSILTRVEAFDECNVWKVACGLHHTLALDSTARNLYSFGRGDYGQLGTTSTLPPAGHMETRPASVSLEEDTPTNPLISQIECGDNHSLLLTEDGEVYTWGYGEMGALGHNKSRDEFRPKKIENVYGGRKGHESRGKVKVRQVSGGGQHSALVVSHNEE